MKKITLTLKTMRTMKILTPMMLIISTVLKIGQRFLKGSLDGNVNLRSIGRVCAFGAALWVVYSVPVLAQVDTTSPIRNAIISLGPNHQLVQGNDGVVRNWIYGRNTAGQPTITAHNPMTGATRTYTHTGTALAITDGVITDHALSQSRTRAAARLGALALRALGPIAALIDLLLSASPTNQTDLAAGCSNIHGTCSSVPGGTVYSNIVHRQAPAVCSINANGRIHMQVWSTDASSVPSVPGGSIEYLNPVGNQRDIDELEPGAVCPPNNRTLQPFYIHPPAGDRPCTNAPDLHECAEALTDDQYPDHLNDYLDENYHPRNWPQNGIKPIPPINDSEWNDMGLGPTFPDILVPPSPSPGDTTIPAPNPTDPTNPDPGTDPNPGTNPDNITVNVNVTMPDTMDVEVQNWPDPVEIDVDGTIPTEQIDLSGLIDIGDGGGGSCPESPSFPIHWGGTHTMDIQPLCDHAANLKPLLLTFAAMAAIGIALGRL